MAPSILTNLGCAGGAAVITVTFIHPIDTVKTRLQVSGTGNARNYAELGLAGTCSTIAKEEGIALCGNQSVRRVHPTILH